MNTKFGITLVFLFSFLPIAFANVRLPALFNDHMVVQRDIPIPVWGWADAGEEVTVSLGDRTGKTAANQNGRWMIKLDSLPAGGPLVLKVQGKNSIERTDVMVGEVWLCSGQSNMEWPVNHTLKPAYCTNPVVEVKESDLPKLRLFKVNRKTAEEPQTDTEGDWKVSNPTNFLKFSAVAYYFGRRLHQDLDVPVGLIESAWSGTPIQAWTGWQALEAMTELAPALDDYRKKVEAWDPVKTNAKYERELADWNGESEKARTEGKPFKAKKPEPPVDPKICERSPSRCYNGMIAPLIPYAIRGVIWYQGEANVGYASLYAIQLKALIAEWRKVWGLGDFPFLFVQLPNIKKPQEKPVEDDAGRGWADIREVFLKALSITNTGMAVTIDIGEADSSHPGNKKDVGNRLAQWALAKTYGKPIVACGPLYKGMRKNGNTIIIEFDHVGGGLMTKNGEKPRGFAVAGADKNFVWAEAKIENNTLVVSSGEVKDPVAVRYGWASNPIVNLYNKEGLPASPFRTDFSPSN